MRTEVNERKTAFCLKLDSVGAREKVIERQDNKQRQWLKKKEKKKDSWIRESL